MCSVLERLNPPPATSYFRAGPHGRRLHAVTRLLQTTFSKSANLGRREVSRRRGGEGRPLQAALSLGLVKRHRAAHQAAYERAPVSQREVVDSRSEDVVIVQE